MSFGDPVHEDDAGWWYWDEFWSERYGPYPSKEAAEEFMRRYARICIQGREWSPHVGEIVRLVRNDLSTALCEVVDPTSHHPRPPYSWSVRLLETGQVLEVYTLALDPVSPLEALAAQAVT